MPKLSIFAFHYSEPMSKKEDVYKSLQEKLTSDFTWPSVYLFKFIIPADNEKLALLESKFNSKEAQISVRNSRNGNYLSVSAKEMMISPESVIERYRSVENIEGIISL
jgi:putative lipoic acid-binding regulatory protein